MNQYQFGLFIKKLREEKNITQAKLAELLSVSDKTISKWETGRGFPDISMIKPLADVLNVSVSEIMSGEDIKNSNKSFNMRRLKIYVCPICGNVIVASGESVISCCGIELFPQEAEDVDNKHNITIEKVEDEYYVSSNHEMTKDHYLSFFLAIKDNGYEMVKLYPEGNAEARFKISMTRNIYFYCNKHGLFSMKIPR